MIDSHAHLSCHALREDLEQILARAKEAGLSSIINICTDPEELAHGILLSKKYPWVKTVGATTPHDVEKEGESAFDAFAKAASEGHLVAIGETGLDYHYEHSPREKQQYFLRRYMHLATDCNLPLVIHCRDAFDDLFKIFEEEWGNNWHPGVLHCFTGTLAEAERLLLQGWMISFSGIVTFKKSTHLQEVARKVPLQNLLIETDSPYLAPQSKRGSQNEPAYLVETAQFLAELKGVSISEVDKATSENANLIFRLISK